MIIDEKTENNTQSQGDDIMDTPDISRENDHTKRHKKGQTLISGVPREGYCFLTGESPVMVKAGAM